ncbi:hypothetical protein HHX38_08595 [Streptomyces sp. PKU-MA01144]|nr:hypothetical protein [Streptomyces sp. PKU-MA01144]
MLGDYTGDGSLYVPPLSTARRMALAALAKHDGASIHDHSAMVSAAVELGYVLRKLLAATGAGDGAA